MQNTWDQEHESADQLPKSELNPLMNPTLGKNLGKWAEVYFTNPPEKREEAVGELLRELGNEGPARPATEDMGAQNTGLRTGISCPSCDHHNPINQKFCGSCGSPLQAADASKAHHHEEAFTDGRPAESPAPVYPENDVQWLRDKALASLEESRSPSRRSWKYPIVTLAVLLAGFALLQWASRSPHPPAAPPAATSPATTPQTGIEADRLARASVEPNRAELAPSAAKNAKLQGTVATRADINRRPLAASLGSTAVKLSADSASASSRPSKLEPAKLETGGGEQELLLGERYLEGKTGARDTREAAKWLWKAVGRQNATAARLLADLYARGDGVPKNCEQARILLLTAAKKGAPEAAQALRNLESGCQ